MSFPEEQVFGPLHVAIGRAFVAHYNGKGYPDRDVAFAAYRRAIVWEPRLRNLARCLGDIGKAESYVQQRLERTRMDLIEERMRLAALLMSIANALAKVEGYYPTDIFGTDEEAKAPDASLDRKSARMARLTIANVRRELARELEERGLRAVLEDASAGANGAARP